MAENALWRITFDTNPDDCNLSCIMCEDHSPYSSTHKNRIANKLPRRRMPIELVEKIFQQASDLGVKEVIPSTMGEPLIYPHFERILDLCHQYGIMLNLTTNGTFPKKGVNKWAELIVPITSDVKISWNGATKKTQESVMLGTKWEKVLENVRSFIAFRDKYAESGGNYCSVTLQLTFMEINLKEIPGVVSLGLDLGIDRIKGHQLWTHGFNELQPQSLRRSPEAVARWNEVVRKSHVIAEERRLKNGKKINLVNFDFLNDNAKADLTPGGQCPFLGKEAWIASDGRFNPCCAPDKERRELGFFGNVNETNLQDIFESQSYNTLCNDYMNNPICKKCNMRQKVSVSSEVNQKEVANVG